MPITDLRDIDTTPGAGNPFAPPLGFEGGLDDYGAWLTDQNRSDLGFAQHMFVLWRFQRMGGTPHSWGCRGPYAERLRSAMAKYDRRMRDRAAPEPSS